MIAMIASWIMSMSITVGVGVSVSLMHISILTSTDVIVIVDVSIVMMGVDLARLNVDIHIECVDVILYGGLYVWTCVYGWVDV